MSVPAINIPVPGATPQANAPGGVGASAGSVFTALLGQMFGDQDSLAAQLFAGAAAGSKTDADAAAEPAQDESADASAQAQAQAQGLAAGFLPPPPVLVDQALTPAAAGEAIDTNAVTAPPAGKIPDGTDQTAVPTDVQATTDQKAPAPAPPPVAGAKPAPAPAPLAPAGDPAAAQAPAATPAPTPAPQIEAAAAAGAAAQASAAAAPQAPAPEKASAAKPADKIEATADVGAVKTAAVAAPQANAGLQNGPGADTDGKPANPDHAAAAKEAAAAERRETPAPQTPAQANIVQVTNPATHAVAGVRGSPETVAHLAAQIAKHLEGRSTQFDIQLSPAGLGQVGVRIEISAHGHLTAAMSFDNPGAAAELRNRAAELTRALEQAGFDISGGISFDVAGDQGRSGYGAAQQDNSDNGGAWRGRAFQAALDVAGETAQGALAGALNLQRRSATGVDIRI